MNRWLSIIGVEESGWDGLDQQARQLIQQARFIVGGERHLRMLPPGEQQRLTWQSPLRKTVDEIVARRGEPGVVLATGDPLWYGVGVTLLRAVAVDEVLIIPARSSFSLACARMGWAVAETACITLHGRKIEQLVRYCHPGAKIIILSHDGQTPREVAAYLCEVGYGSSQLTVWEHLGAPDEKRHIADARSWPDIEVRPLNIIAVECRIDADTRLLSSAAGLPDEAFQHDGQITKREARALALAALIPIPGQILWDVGAGCGSIGIEWLRSVPRAKAYAVERDSDRCQMIASNAQVLGVPELTICNQMAPDGLAALPTPQAIFIGGGLSHPGLAEECWHRLEKGGRMVAHAVTAEGEAKLYQLRETLGGQMTRLMVSRLDLIGRYSAWRPLMPVTHWAARK